MAKFVPRQRKHKVLARASAKENARRPIQDTNQEILPADKADREEKKARIKAELLLQGEKPSGKKAKRLEKFLDNKLRKDENRELLAKLADRKIDTSLFASTRSMGQGRETKRQAISRALRETRAGLGSQETDGILLERRRSPGEEDGDFGSGDESDSHLQEDTGKDPHVAQLEADSRLQQDQLAMDAASQGALESRLSTNGAVGSGLKRPLELDEGGRPVIKKRQKRGGVESRARIDPRASEQAEYEEWGGLMSEGDADGDPNSDISSEDESESESEHQSDPDSEQDSSQSSSQQGGDEQKALKEEDGEAGKQQAQRSSAFKAWAHQQRNQALGYQPVNSTADTPAMAKPGAFVPRVPESDPLPRELQPTTRTDRKAFTVALNRRPEMQEARLKLPVVAEEQRLMEAIHEHDVVVVCGSTGSGKTTQVPQFLLEAGYGSPGSPTPGLIGITQPRRVAAVSMSKRVAEEVGDQAKSVAYQIRFEGTVDAQTAIKFMTDGVLLREVGQDITLGKYSAIIVDEAHERSVNTDILIGMLSRVVKLRAELAGEDATMTRLKVIIMSATLRVQDLTLNPTLFATPPPVVEVEGRQHPVTIHFSRKTRSDYLDEAFRKISRGHRKLPPGSFLVFLTGRNEIHHLSRRLKAAFGGPGTSEMPRVQITASEAPVEVEDLDLGEADDDAVHTDGSDGWLSDEEEEGGGEFQIEEDQPPAPLKMRILPLYSLLPTKEQLRVFEPVPDGYRQVVLATNVAETSLTIPGIRFVFDCGRSKERHYDRLSGVQSYEIGWISKASAGQRSGRAGRTGPGHCYRLYSSAVYERDFPEFAEPELLRMPVEGVVLRLKAMNLHKVVNFPFPTPPDRQRLAEAEKVLAYLSAVSGDGRVTAVGRTMSIFPLSPRFARILLVGHLHDCMPYTIALVAGLSVGDIFVAENQMSGEGEAEVEEKQEDAEEAGWSGEIRSDGEERAQARRAYGQVQRAFSFLDDRSDAIKLLQVVGEFAHEPTEAWCESHFVRYKALREAEQLRRQLTDLLRVNIPSLAGLGYKERLDAPTAKQVRALKQMVAAGFVDQVAIRADLAPEGSASGGARVRRARRAMDVAYLPLVPLPAGARDGDGTGFVYIHPSSVLARLSVEECPEYVVYGYLQRATAKTRMRPLTDVSGGQLSGLARGTPLLRYGKPIKEVSRPAAGATTRECWVVPYLRAEHVSGQGWPLPAKKVKQKRVPGKGWVVVDE